MISEIYLKKATKIRKDYIDIIKNISVYEKISKDLAKVIELKIQESKVLLERINSGKISNIEVAKDELHKIIISLEEDINKVDKSIDTLNKNMDNLAKDEVSLYKEIKQAYFSLSDEEIGKYIQDHFNKQNLS